jgi:hypothetical protein
MSKDYATLRVPEKELNEARQAKRDDETWGEYLLRCADADIPQKWTSDEIDARIERKLDDLRSEMRR